MKSEVPEDRTTLNRNVNNISLQTGEEFAAEFLQDRAALRRLPSVITNVNQHSPRRVGCNLNAKNHQLGYEDHTGNFGLRRMDSDDFVPSPGYVADVNHKGYPSNISRYYWEYGGAGQVSSKVYDEKNRNCVFAGQTSPHHHYAIESPRLYHPYVPVFSEGSFSGKMKFLCSFGGRIVQRPGNGKVRYVGGDTRILSIRKNIMWGELMKKTFAICNQPHTIKYQLPGEDLDSLISVCSDEDLYNMIEEYQELERIGSSQRLRIFLVSLNESESSSSVEVRTMQPNSGEYQYAPMDRSPRKSSSGQSLASQSSQFGNNSDYSPSFPRDSPTSAYALEKDCSPSNSNLMGLFTGSFCQFSPKLLPSKSFNQLPSMSHVPFQHMDHDIPNAHYYADHHPHTAVEGDAVSPIFMGKFPGQDSYYADAMGYYHGPSQQMNYHHHNMYLVDTDQTSRPHRVTGFHHRSRSEDFEPFSLNARSGLRHGRPMPKEGGFYNDGSLSHPQDPPGLLSGSNDKDGSDSKMTQVISDSKLHELDLKPLEEVNRAKLPLMTTTRSSNDSQIRQEKIAKSGPHLEPHCKEDSGEDMLKWKNRNNSQQDQYIKEFRENIEFKPYVIAMKLHDLPNINYLQNANLSSHDLLSVSEFYLPVIVFTIA